MQEPGSPICLDLQHCLNICIIDYAPKPHHVHKRDAFRPLEAMTSLTMMLLWRQSQINNFTPKGCPYFPYLSPTFKGILIRSVIINNKLINSFKTESSIKGVERVFLYDFPPFFIIGRQNI